jgi:2-hydroxy-6-oxo-octa-2,4-dienoate hydrolase
MDQTVAFDPADPAAGRSVAAAGLRTHYLEAGSGAPLILLHGSGPGVSAWENWAEVIPALARRRRVIAPDIPGFGATERRTDGQYDMAFWVDHLLAFMDTLGIVSAPLVGNSFGGMLAMAASLRDSARVERLVLMGSAAGDIPMSEAHKLASRYNGTREKLAEILRLFPFDPTVLTEEMLDRRYAVSVQPDAKKSPHPVPTVENDRGERVFRMSSEAELEAVQTPTLILHGRDDKVLPLDLAIRLHRAIGPSQLHAFGDCGHWVQLERKDEFVAQVLEFVDRAR